MKMSGDIWIRRDRRINLLGNKNVEFVESQLESLFEGGYPVLFASARAAMMQVFANFFPEEVVRIFPYASQCVVKSVNRSGKFATTPLPGQLSDVRYHQWGMRSDEQEYVFMRDCADSLYPVGGNVCKLNSRFEVWSLPKIIGTSFGAVIWCRDKNDAMALKKIRSECAAQSSILSNVLETIKYLNPSSYSFWEEYQFAKPALNGIQIKTLNKRFQKWSDYYEERKKVFLQIYLSSIETTLPQRLSALEDNDGVIPTVIETDLEEQSAPFRKLHKILSDGSCKQVRVIAYQSGLRIR